MATPDLELRHLSALVAVADEGSFGRAATRLGYTQSAVSQQIAALERGIGLAMFDRPAGPRRPELTPAGAVLLDHARAILDRVTVAADEVDRMRRGITGRLVIGTFQSVSAKLLPDIIGRMRADLPHVELQLFETDNQAALLDGIRRRDLDLAFTVDTNDGDEFTSTFLGCDPFVVMVSVDDPIGATAGADDINGHPIIGQPESSICQQLIDRRLLAVGIRADYVFRSMDNGAVQGMVRSGMGRAIMPLLAVDADDPTTVVLDFDPPIEPRTIQLTRARHRTLPPAAERFSEIAAEVAAGRLRPAALPTT